MSVSTDGIRGWIDDGSVHTHTAIPVTAGPGGAFTNATVFRVGESGFDVQANGGSPQSGSFGTWGGGTPALILGNNPGKTFGMNGQMLAFAVFNEKVSDELAAKLYAWSRAAFANVP